MSGKLSRCLVMSRNLKRKDKRKVNVVKREVNLQVKTISNQKRNLRDGGLSALTMKMINKRKLKRQRLLMRSFRSAWMLKGPSK